MEFKVVFSDQETETEAPTDFELEFIVLDDEALERLYRIIIHNDPVTTFEFVINILVTVFQLSFFKATRVTFEAHHKGNAYVSTLPLEEAKSRVFKAQFAARERGFPLTFTLEPE